jgi:hypothetical protein
VINLSQMFNSSPYSLDSSALNLNKGSKYRKGTRKKANAKFSESERRNSPLSKDECLFDNFKEKRIAQILKKWELILFK